MAGKDGRGSGRVLCQGQGQKLAPPNSPRGGKPPEISDPDLHSALGKSSKVGILSLLVNLKFFVERTQLR